MKLAKPVFFANSFTSPCAGIPHIGSKGWVCRDAYHQKRAREVGRICVLFRARYDPSDGCPRVPGGYVPVHLFFPPNYLTKRSLSKKKIKQLRTEFDVKKAQEKTERELASKTVMADLKSVMAKLDALIAADL